MKKKLCFLSSLLTLLLVAGTASQVAAADVETVERGNLRIQGIPEIPQDLTERLQQFQNTRAASLQGWMPDGKGLLISTRFGETSQLHVVEMPGGARRQITFFDEPVGGAAVGPDAKRNSLLFSRDVGGSEFFQIFHFDLATGQAQMLTDGSSRNGGQLWSKTGDRFAYFTTKRNGRDWDIHVMDVAKGTSSAALEKEGVWFPTDWSPDDERLLVGRYISANESYPYLLDVASGELTSLHQSDEKVAYGGALFDASGDSIYYVSDESSEFKRLRRRNLETGETVILTADIDWDVEGLELSDDGKRLAFTVNEEGFSRLYVMDTTSDTRLSIPDLPLGAVFGLEFGPTGQLGLTLNTPTSVSDVYVLDLGAGEVSRWTYSEVGGLDTESLVEPRLIRYPTFDEVDGSPRTIPAFVYQPEGEGPFPVILDIHGGPEGQERPTFNSGTQFLASELGVAVIAPNVRGSSGYGKSYLKLDNGYLREDSVKDIGALLDWIATQPKLDEKRVAVYGGSYGGYMVLASLVHYDDRLRAGVDIVGISNFVTFLKNTQDYRRDLRRAEYGDERDPKMNEFLTRISPTTRAAEITTPLFVIQGQNDPRVPASESEQMVDVIRSNGGDVWYLLALDEGHGFRKKSNRDYMMESAALFLQTHLLGE
ncbi:MAG: S9 family peptidase [Thermoanaerobaculia bacterium]|nr:S9 family peptidase [Thermoanaerobaculia bacterium]